MSSVDDKYIKLTENEKQCVKFRYIVECAAKSAKITMDQADKCFNEFEAMGGFKIFHDINKENL